MDEVWDREGGRGAGVVKEREGKMRERTGQERILDTKRGKNKRRGEERKEYEIAREERKEMRDYYTAKKMK